MRSLFLLSVPMLCALVAGCAKPVPRAAPIAVPPVRPIQIFSTPATVTPRKTAAPAATVDHCPTSAEIRRLRAARPKPLRTQPMPASPAERVARTSAQLGQYEARGAWADQVEDAFARCDP